MLVKQSAKVQLADDGHQSTMKVKDLVTVELPGGGETIGVVLTVYADNYCVIAFVEEGQRRELMTHVAG